VDDLLARSPFYGLHADSREALGELLAPETLKRGVRLYSPGDESDALYLVVSGKVKVSRMASDGRECVLEIVGPGQLFGEMAVFDPAPRTTYAAAITRTELLRLDAVDAQGLIDTDPDFSRALLAHSAARLRAASDSLTALVLSDAPGRLARLLIQLAKRFGRHESGAIVLNHDLTQQELAYMVGASRETVNKALVDFANRDWIHCQSRSVTILHPEKLEARAS